MRTAFVATLVACAAGSDLHEAAAKDPHKVDKLIEEGKHDIHGKNHALKRTPMHAAALLQPHIDAPPKLSELLTMRSATHAALARCDGGRTAHESGCVHAARSLAACCELLPAVAEQGLTAPLKASLTPLSHALQLLGRGAITLRSAAACAALLPRGASDARARLADAQRVGGIRRPRARPQPQRRRAKLEGLASRREAGAAALRIVRF